MSFHKKQAILLWLTLPRSKSYITVTMLKPFVILLLLAAAIVGAACQPSLPTSTITPGLPSPTLAATPMPTLSPTPMPTVTPTSTPIPTLAPNELDPSQFIPLLRQVSDPFDHFYGNEIEPLHAEIHWFYNPNIGDFFVTTPLHNFEAFRIDLSHIPNLDEGNISLEKDAFILAHELATLVVGPKFAKGWRLQCGVRAIYFDMFDMISTPLRNQKLTEYHFDVLGDFQYRNDIWLTSDCELPVDPLTIHDLAFFYVYFALYWQYALDNPNLPPDIDNWFQSCAPNARQEGLDILGMIDKIGGLGNITVDSAKELFRQIIGNDSLDCQIIEIK
jgi:hypothetical protein